MADRGYGEDKTQTQTATESMTTTTAPSANRLKHMVIAAISTET